MKKPGVILIIFSLAFILLFSACANRTSAAAMQASLPDVIASITDEQHFTPMPVISW